jgi:hypothetical protein
VIFENKIIIHNRQTNNRVMFLQMLANKRPQTQRHKSFLAYVNYVLCSANNHLHLF